MAFYRGRHSPFQIYRFHGISASISGHPLRPTTFLHSMVLVAQGTLARTSSGIRRENCLFWKVLLLNSRGSAGAFPRRRINQPRRNMNAYPPPSLSLSLVSLFLLSDSTSFFHFWKWRSPRGNESLDRLLLTRWIYVVYDSRVEVLIVEMLEFGDLRFFVLFER